MSQAEGARRQGARAPGAVKECGHTFALCAAGGRVLERT